MCCKVYGDINALEVCGFTKTLKSSYRKKKLLFFLQKKIIDYPFKATILQK